MTLHIAGLRVFDPKDIPAIGVILACLYWFADSAIDTYFFEGHGLYLENLLRPEFSELYMRSQVILLMMMISKLAMFALNMKHNIELKSQEHKCDLENIVYERTVDLSLKNAVLEKEIMERLKIEADLVHLATIDPLTSIPNRRKFNEVLDYELRRDSRYHNELSLILCDLDHFKQINDVHGHNIGDEILKEFSQLVSDNIRKTDIFARWGGEEFVLLLPSTDINTAVDMAEKLRQLTEEYRYPNVEKMTASFGVTQLIKGDNETKLINRADEALYKAKETGRNKVETIPPLQFPLHLTYSNRTAEEISS